MAALPPQLIGQSPAFHALMDQVSNVAALGRTAIVVGERGTGKELIASRLHFLSPRWEQTFVRINCAAFDELGQERELFGYTEGIRDQEGRLVEAEGGTLFIDNIDALSLRLQEKLLQALEFGEITPLGDTEAVEIDARIIAGAGIDLPAAVIEGKFSPDLLGRLAGDVVTLPPLRDRKDDIAPLCEHFGRRVASDLGAESFPGLTPEALAFLMDQIWPGNIRELRTVIERSVSQAFLADETLSTPIQRVILNPFESPWSVSGEVAHTSDRPDAPKELATNDFQERVFNFERGLIDEALSLTENHQGKAADYLGLTYHQFRGLLRKHGLKK